MVALANRPTLPAPGPPAPRPDGRGKEQATGSRPAPASDDAERPTFLRALLRALGTMHT